MVIYLVRHGETDWNRQNRLQGIEDIELNENGIKQSLECARALAHIPIDRILSSPLKRAKVTADIICEHTGAASVFVEEGLTERDFGKLSGLSLEDREAMLARNEDTGAEPMGILTDRLMKVLGSYIKARAFETILVVSHGASINAILAHLSKGEIGAGKTILKNTCINKLNIHDDIIHIEYYNLTPEEFVKTTH